MNIMGATFRNYFINKQQTRFVLFKLNIHCIHNIFPIRNTASEMGVEKLVSLLGLG